MVRVVSLESAHPKHGANGSTHGTRPGAGMKDTQGHHRFAQLSVAMARASGFSACAAVSNLGRGFHG